VVPILVRATMRVAVVVITGHHMLLPKLFVVFLGVIDDVHDDGGNIIIIGARGDNICGSIDVMIII